MLFITGRIGSPSLCVFMYAFNCGVVGLICNKNFCWFLSMSVWHLWIACWICLCYWSVGSLGRVVIPFSCMNVCIFCSNIVLLIMTMALFLSALATVRLSFCSMSFIWFKLCWCLLCIVWDLLVVMICLILFVAICLKVFWILGSRCLIAFSVSIIRLCM